VNFPPPPVEASAALASLVSLDADQAGVLTRAGPLPWRTRSPGFPGLLQAIVAQMISNQAAAAIWGRLRLTPGALEPAGTLALPDEALRAAGLSRPRVLHAHALATGFLDGTLDAGRLASMDDEAAIVTIASVRGLGRWTAEIYLLFALDRLDVFPAGDIALAATVLLQLAALDALVLDAVLGRAPPDPDRVIAILSGIACPARCELVGEGGADPAGGSPPARKPP
jgi:DNA-3-methyladenine glycosylase II